MTHENWTPRETPTPERLDGQYTRLERLDWARHGGGLYQAVCGETNEDLWHHMPCGPFHSREAFQQEFEHLRVTFGWETMIICSRGSGRVLGMASYMRLRLEHGSAEIGCVTFGRDLQRTRHATEAVFLMGQYLFDKLGYRRFEWKCDNANTASRRAAVRFGFAFEGVFRNDMVMKGRNRDTAWLAMTDDDWPAISAGFKAWLAPDNFDADGQQKAPLSIAARADY